MGVFSGTLGIAHGFFSAKILVSYRVCFLKPLCYRVNCIGSLVHSLKRSLLSYLPLIGSFDNYCSYLYFISSEKDSNTGRRIIDIISAYRYLVNTREYICKFSVFPRARVGKSEPYTLLPKK